MGGYAVRYGRGRFNAADNDLVFVPRDQQPNRYAVVLCHSMGDPVTVFSNTVNAQAKFAAGLCAAGLTVIATDMGGDTFGNATATARIEEIRTNAGTYGCSTAKVVGVGASMGGAAVWGYRRDYPTRIAAVTTLIGAADLDDIRNNNRGGARAAIDAAYGVTYPAALPAGANPAVNGATLSGIPSLHYYSTGDTIVLPSTTTAFAAAVGGTAIVLGSAEHSDAMAGAAPVADVVAFCRANGA